MDGWQDSIAARFESKEKMNNFHVMLTLPIGRMNNLPESAASHHLNTKSNPTLTQFRVETLNFMLSCERIALRWEISRMAKCSHYVYYKSALIGSGVSTAKWVYLIHGKHDRVENSLQSYITFRTLRVSFLYSMHLVAMSLLMHVPSQKTYTVSWNTVKKGESVAFIWFPRWSRYLKLDYVCRPLQRK